MTWDVWSGDGRGEKVELATLELTEVGALSIGVAFVFGTLFAALWLVAAFVVDPVFGPVPKRRARVPLPWHA